MVKRHSIFFHISSLTATVQVGEIRENTSEITRAVWPLRCRTGLQWEVLRCRSYGAWNSSPKTPQGLPIFPTHRQSARKCAYLIPVSLQLAGRQGFSRNRLDSCCAMSPHVSMSATLARSLPHKRVALYARVSTKNNGQDPETQLIGAWFETAMSSTILCG